MLWQILLHNSNTVLSTNPAAENRRLRGGLEAAKRIRALDSEYAKTVPMIAMTANAYEEDIHRSLEVGMDAYLSKPIAKEIFFDTMLKYIGTAHEAVGRYHRKGGGKMKNVPKIRKKKICGIISLALVLTLVFAMPDAVLTRAAEEPVIRVGYFAFEGYHNQDAEGNRSGYGYEYLQQMARYTGWTYDYVGYDGSWSDAQEQLKHGEIDLLTSAQKTEEREKIFDFSDDPIGYSSTIFSIKAGNTEYTIDDFSSFNGVRVGMIEGNSRNAQFDAFAVEKDFSYTPVMFEEMDALTASLQDGSIDAIVTSSLRATAGEWIVASFAVSPFYVCVKKGNQALLDQVNTAIASINQNSPGIQNELENKYYGVDSSGKVAFTEAERSYIADMQQRGEIMTVLMNPDRVPMSFFEEGKVSGIFGETLERLMEMSGLPYEVMETANREEYENAKEEHQADLCADMRFDFNNAETQGYRLTDSFYQANISRVTKSGFAGEVKSVAAIAQADISSYLKQQLYQNAELVYYPTTDACIQAVLDGEQDAAFVYTSVAEDYINQSARHQLAATLMPDFATSFCIGIGDTSDTVLFSILNKCVANLDEYWLDGVTLSYTGTGNQDVSLIDLFYVHPLAGTAAILVLLGMAGLLLYLIFRQHARKKDAERAREIQRLFRYVCREHEKVMEVNLKTMTAREYYLEENTLCITEHAFKTENNFLGFMHPEDYAALMDQFSEEQMHDLIQNGSEFIFEGRGKEADGDYKWYIYTLYGIVPDRQHPCNFMLFKHDINDMKQKEEENKQNLKDALQMAREASQAKGSFLSRMSHEIRTPLNAVIGYMQIAKDSENNPSKVMHCVENSETAARHLLSIINDVLDISSIESGKMKLANESFDLKSQISAVTTIFFNQAKNKGVRFEAMLDGVTQEWVVGDSLRLQQILMNLLSNAVKFTPEGGKVKLTVTQVNTDEACVFMKFSVSDTGIGMSEEYRQRMFKPFEQENARTAQKYGGTGLGLSITFNLIQMMGGSIDVSGKQGEGTTFVVSLRFGRSTEQTKTLSVQDYSHLRALVVDDDEAACAYMKAMLRRCRVKCDVVSSGEEALRQIRRRIGSEYKYDLCIMDWNMPEMNGIETARKIRDEFKENLPIIIATAYDVTEFVDDAEEIGITKIIAKPLFQSTMFDLLVSTFGKYEPMKAVPNQDEGIQGLHILLAEDNPMNMEIAMEILGKSGLIVDSATDGKQAAGKFIDSPAGAYDAILMDVQMPVMNGYEATGVIRRSAHPQAKTIPIIAMTANAFAEDVNAALAAGMNGHIAKPVEYQKLYQALRECVNQGKL